MIQPFGFNLTSLVFVPNCSSLLLIVNFPIYILQNYSCMIHFLLQNGGDLTAALPSLHVTSTQWTHGNKPFLFPSWRSPTIMLPPPRSVGLLDKRSLGQLHVFQSGWPNTSQHAMPNSHDTTAQNHLLDRAPLGSPLYRLCVVPFTKQHRHSRLCAPPLPTFISLERLNWFLSAA